MLIPKQNKDLEEELLNSALINSLYEKIKTLTKENKYYLSILEEIYANGRGSEVFPDCQITGVPNPNSQLFYKIEKIIKL